MAFDSTFVADEAVVSALASQHFTGTHHARFALVDLGVGMTQAPADLISAYLRFRAGVRVVRTAPANRPTKRVSPRLEADDRCARHLVAIEATAPGMAVVVGCVQIRLRSGTEVPRLALPQRDHCGDSGDGLQVEMSQFTVRHREAPVRRWIHTWLMSEVLAEATRLRQPWAFATVTPAAEAGLAHAGVAFERVGVLQHARGYRDTLVMLRINALASLRRLRLDYRVPKLATVTWTG